MAACLLGFPGAPRRLVTAVRNRPGREDRTAPAAAAPTKARRKIHEGSEGRAAAADRRGTEPPEGV
jgi:hypothetical protein